MLPEIDVATNFLTHYLPSSSPSDQRSLFHTALRTQLVNKFATSWDPLFPTRGNAYRAISILEGRMDPLILSAAEVANIPTSDLSSSFPRELVLWTDPGSVAFRVGEYGFPTTIWEDASVILAKQSLSSVPAFRLRTKSSIPFIAPSSNKSLASPSAEPASPAAIFAQPKTQYANTPVQPILVS
ncbi:hypothetical protein HK097_007886 [Rhizophlyctis rosea]|uniref:Anti-proliferative protein domain-containing protein n=1 Tax=Rhizophlyctis rosea TaxID=64517 RepID=A0AAD5SQ92_9FUNG|nr:hypothetical protein HK097_007886 [Rhizophlyctis rosea]